MSTTPTDPTDPNDPTDPTTPKDPWEREMSSEFERRVRDLHEAPLDLSHVKGKAMNIKRKRQAYVAAGVAAVAAAVVPIALLVSGSTDSDSLQPAGPSTTIVDTQSPSETPAPAPAGPDLGFGYITADAGNATLHPADGSVIELPGPGYTDAAVLGDALAAFRQDDDAAGFVDVIEDGTVTTTYEARSSMVVTPTGSAVAFMTTDGELLVLGTGGEKTSFGTDFDADDYPAALIGDGDCGLESGCHPFLNSGGGEKAPYEINYEGPNTDVVPDAVRLNDATDDFLATIQTSFSDDGSCGGLYDRQAQEFVFETCASQVLDISPRHDFVIGTDPYGDGAGPGYFTILDTTGAEVARYTPEQGYLYQMAWADDTHAVATVYDGARWHLVSLDTDGDIAELVDPVPGTDVDPAFYLTGRG